MVQKVLYMDNFQPFLLLRLVTRIPKWFILVVLLVFLLSWRRSKFTETFTGIPEANL